MPTPESTLSTHHPSKVLTRTQLKTELGISLSNPTIIRLERRGLFPNRFYLSEKRPVWREQEVIDWLNAKQTAGGSPLNTEAATAGRRRQRDADAQVG